MAILTTVAASLAAAAVPYTPDLLTTDLATGVATILPWVGAGVGGGVALMFIFMGIRKGFGFFKSIANK